ncbi:MAG: hypothetical protein KF816_03705 [Melioribacteraceae bacterium]|jgi:hypothetical protein|nr:hypothetical protein [Melioribacteraceae bacterium]
MFRYFVIIVFALAFIYLNNVLKKNNSSYSRLYKGFTEELKRVFGEIYTKKQNTSFAEIRKFLLFVNIFLVILLILTSFIPVVIFNVHMTGLLLLIHVKSALLFLIALTGYVLMSAHANRFIENEISRSKIVFWLLVFFSFPVIISILLMLFPLFGSDGIDFLLDTHRYSTTMFTIALLFHIYYVISVKRKNYEDIEE